MLLQSFTGCLPGLTRVIGYGEEGPSNFAQ